MEIARKETFRDWFPKRAVLDTLLNRTISHTAEAPRIASKALLAGRERRHVSSEPGKPRNTPRTPSKKNNNLEKNSFHCILTNVNTLLSKGPLSNWIQSYWIQ